MEKAFSKMGRTFFKDGGFFILSFDERITNKQPLFYNNPPPTNPHYRSFQLF